MGLLKPKLGPPPLSPQISNLQILQAIAEISAGQINAGNDLQLLPAPGVGLYYYPVGIEVIYFPGDTPFQVDSQQGSQGLVVKQGGVNSSNLAAPGFTNWQSSTNENLPKNIVEVFFANTNVIPDTQLENQALILSFVNTPCGGTILAAAVGAGGSGYSPGDTLSVDGLANQAVASLTVNTVDGSGAVLTFTIANGGAGYSVTNGVTCSGGAGTGFTLNITQISQGNGTLQFTVFYMLRSTTGSQSLRTNKQVQMQVSRQIGKQTAV